MKKSNFMRLIRLNVIRNKNPSLLTSLTSFIDNKRWLIVIVVALTQLFTIPPVWADDNEPTVQTTDAHEQLLNVVTSSDFAESQEVKKWVPIQRPADEPPTWLGELIEWIIELLFNGDSNGSSNLSWWPAVIKGLLILGLITFIVWVLRKASVQAWFASLKNPLSKKPSVSAFEPAVLAQSWESLPAHRDIPNAVQQLIADNDIEQAASVLYRGSLRWLNQTQKLAIKPATTEKQCLSQIAHIAEMSKSPAALTKSVLAMPLGNQSGSNSSMLNTDTANYLTQIIYLWLQVAYDPRVTQTKLSSDINNSNSNNDSNAERHVGSDNAVLQELKMQITVFTKGWMKNLPLGVSANVSTKSLTTITSLNEGGVSDA